MPGRWQPSRYGADRSVRVWISSAPTSGCRVRIRADESARDLVRRSSPLAICSAQWQATRLPADQSRSSGRSSAQRVGCAHGQRVWNRQPDGGLAGDGRSPASRIRSRRSSTSGSGTGTADISARVYGCSGSRVELVARRLLDQRAQVHHADRVGDVPDHGQVVRDHQVGQPQLVLQLAPAG